MNLGKLLVAGKSVIGGRQKIAYHICDRTYLPKFVSPKNPFAPPIKAEPTLTTAATPTPKAVASDGTKPQKPPAFPAARPRRVAWVGKLNPISFWRGSRSKAPKKALFPAQAELSLDRVKVMHNDLSDADVQIVPIKSRPASAAAEPVLTPANGGDTWSRLSARIFGVKAA